MEFLFVLSIMAVIAGILIGLIFFIEGEPIAIFGLLLVLVGGFVGYSIYDTDPTRAIDKNAIHERIGTITELSNGSVEIDNDDSYYFRTLISEKFNTNKDVKLGDVVKVTYLEGAVYDYAAKVAVVAVTETGGQ